MYAVAAAVFGLDKKSKTSPVLASLFHNIEIQDTKKKKTRVQVQSETYESESSKSGLESDSFTTQHCGCGARGSGR